MGQLGEHHPNKPFHNSFIPAVIMEWNKIDADIHNSASCNFFKKVVLKFTRKID